MTIFMIHTVQRTRCGNLLLPRMETSTLVPHMPKANQYKYTVPPIRLYFFAYYCSYAVLSVLYHSFTRTENLLTSSFSPIDPNTYFCVASCGGNFNTINSMDCFHE